MRVLDRLHPTVTFIYFLAGAVFAMCFINPLYQSAALLCGAVCCIARGKGKVLIPALSVAVLAAVINILFNHRGATVLFYISGANAITVQSAVYSLCAGMMICSVILWFACFSSVITSEKLVYITGRAAPTLALLFSMTMRFVPLFHSRIIAISQAQKGIGNTVDKGLIKKTKNAAAILSAAVSWSLEEAVSTADSMKGRGFGTAKRTSFSIYRYTRRDIVFLIFTVLLIAFISVAAVMGAAHFECYPRISYAVVSPLSVCAAVLFSIYCASPLLLAATTKNNEKRSN